LINEFPYHCTPTHAVEIQFSIIKIHSQLTEEEWTQEHTITVAHFLKLKVRFMLVEGLYLVKY